MTALRSIYTWTAATVIVLAALPTLALVRLFDRDPGRYATGRVFRTMGSWVTRVNPAWTIETSGPAPPDPRRPYVVVSNHQSNADIPVISRLPWEMKWVAKKALFDLPVFGWLMKLAGDIPVDRRDPDSRARVLVRAHQVLKRRVSVMLMPEGTRSKDGRIKPFQNGAFRLAIEAGVPVLPLAIDGTANALPRDGWQFQPGVCVRLKVLDPVPTAGLTPEDAPALRERVRRLIGAQIADWRGSSLAEVLTDTPVLDAQPVTDAPGPDALRGPGTVLADLASGDR